MSHFSVLVIRRPDQSLDELLQPFHEFECTGNADRYVQNIDLTEQARKEYEEATTRRYRDMSGKLHDPYQDEFYREFTAEELERIRPCGSGSGHGLSYFSKDWGDGKGHRPKAHFLPTGWEDIKVMTRDEETFLEWADGWYGYKPVAYGEKPDFAGEHKYGFVELSAAGEIERIVKRTNQEAKWDWWTIGGRYSGKFAGAGKLAPHEDPRNMEPCFLCLDTPGMRNDKLGREQRAKDPAYTCNGCDGTGRSLKHAPKWVDEDNEIRVGDLDIDKLKERTVGEREAWVAKIQVESGLTRAEIEIACHLKRVSHAEWLTLPEPKPRGADYHKWMAERGGDYLLVERLNNACPWENPDLEEGQSLAAWIAAAPPLTTFAVLKDGKWHERGEMGWWACVSNEKDKGAWEREVESLIRGLDPDMIITCVDCHI